MTFVSIICMEKYVSPWKYVCSVQSAEVKQLFAEAEGLRSEVKSKDEKMCVKEIELQ